jgi:hypothetical protein
MFHFGLFSTFVPYLVIAAIYFCGLASYSVDIVNRHISDNQSKAEYTGEYDLSIDAGYLHFNIDKNSSTQSINITDKEYIYTTYINAVFWHTFKPDFEKNYYYFSIFSRPPPYLS